MKIIEYTLGLPPFRRGGLPRYSKDLSIELSKKDEVYLLYPGYLNPFSKKIRVKIRKKDRYPFHLIELENMLPISLGLGLDGKKLDKYCETRDISELKKIIEQVSPKVVHFHTFMGVPKEFLEYLHKRKIKIIFTTHDFYGLCPKMLSKDAIHALSNSKCTDDCMLCKEGPSYTKLIIMQSHLYKIFKEKKIMKMVRRRSKEQISFENNNKKRSLLDAKKRFKLYRYYLEMYHFVDKFHFNSTVSSNYVKKFLPKSAGEILPITHANLIDQRDSKILKKHDLLRIGYVGPYDHKKGFFRLLEISKCLNGISIDFYGDIANNECFNQQNIRNHGIISADKLKKAYRKMDILVVPSLWHETFGFVVLEALLQGTPCLVSENVGAKDLVPNNCIFHDDSELIFKLNDLKNPQKLAELNKKIKTLNVVYKMSDHTNKLRKEFYRS